MSTILSFSVLLCLAATVTSVHNNNSHPTPIKAGGSRETIAVAGALVGREILGDTEDIPMRLVQSSDGNMLIYSIFDASDRLTDCNIVFDPVEVGAFVSAIHNPDTTGNSPVVIATTEEASRLLAVEQHRSACERLKWSNGREDGERRSRRSKRHLFIAPGTYWCGMGNIAQNSRQLGENSAADRCCMEHDGCPYFIPAVSSRYDYYNWRTHTLSYCACDQRFHKCLKEASTASADLVGNVFFNVVNRACFELQREKVCAEYNWWGTCRKWKTGLVAQVLETPRF